MLLAPRWFNRILKATLGSYLSYRYNVRGVNEELLKKLRPPYLLIPNHVNFWDPFLISLFVKRPVYFVAADGNFRSTLMRRLLSLVGAIPKAKAKSDAATVRSMVELLRRGEVVGVFAEGQRTWDGESLEPLPATAKLIRFLQTTVVVPHFRGAYLSLPRWSPYRRKGVLEIEFDKKRVLPGNRLSDMSLAEIDEWLRGALSYSETDWQAARRIPFYSRRQAEYAETLLYACPDCGAFATLESEGNHLRCSECGFGSRFNRYGDLTGPHRGVAAWNSWQHSYLRERLSRWLTQSGNEPFATIPGVTLRTGRGARALRRQGDVSLELCRAGLRIIPKKVGAESGGSAVTAPLLLPFQEIHGVHVQLRQDLELYHGQRLYVLTPRCERRSAHFWEQLVLASQELGFTG